MQDIKYHELENIYVNLKFTNALSPNGWQMFLMSVTENSLHLKPSGEHAILNSTGQQIQV